MARDLGESSGSRRDIWDFDTTAWTTADRVKPRTRRNSIPMKYTLPRISSHTLRPRRAETRSNVKIHAVQPRTIKMSSCDASSRPYGTVALCHISNGGRTDGRTSAAGCAATRKAKRASSTQSAGA